MDHRIAVRRPFRHLRSHQFHYSAVDLSSNNTALAFTNRMTGRGVATPTNSIPVGVNVCEPKRSALNSADNSLAAKAVDHSTDDDDDFAPVSTPIALIRPTGTFQHGALFNPGQLASFNSSSSNPELGDFEHATSDSANNPSTSTDRFTTDERYDEYIEHGKCDDSSGDGSEVAGRASVSQLGGEPSRCEAIRACEYRKESVTTASPSECQSSPPPVIQDKTGSLLYQIMSFLGETGDFKCLQFYTALGSLGNLPTLISGRVRQSVTS